MEEEDFSGSEPQDLSNQEEGGSIADEFNFFESQLPSYPELLKHPIFELKEDPIFSIFIEAIRPLIKAIPNKSGILGAQTKIKEMLFSEIFGDKKIPELKKEYSILGSPKTICGKLIGKEEIYFRCLDCDMHENNSFVSLLCIGCFEKSNHEGHRLIIVKKENNSSATCDCGDADVFNSDGFCPEHQPKEVDVDALLKKFPQEMLQKFQVTLQKALYASMSFFEIAQRSANRIVGEAVEILADMCVDEVLSLCVLCYSEINESFLHLIGHILKSAFPEPYNKVWHDCEDNSAEKDPSTFDIENPHECKCIILVNLLRIGNVMTIDKQAKLHKILVECAKENHFKEFLVVEYTKYVQFLYSTDYVNDDYEDNSNSRLLNMKTQLYGRDSLMMTALNSGHFDNFINMMRKVINGAQDTNHGVYHILADLRSSILYFLNAKYKSAEILLKNTNLLNNVLGVLTLFQTRFVYQGRIHIGVFDHNVEYKRINSRLMIEKVLSQVLEAGIRLICRYPKEEKIALCKQLISEWQTNFLLAKESLDDDIKHGAVSFNPGLERFFVSLLKCYMGSNISLQAIHEFFNEVLPDTKPNEVAEKVMEGVLRNLGMVRFLHMVHNFKAGPLWHVYYFFNNVFFEMDIVTVQMMSIMVRPEVLFELLTENFFSYSSELREFFKNPEALKDGDYIKQKLSTIEDFLNFLIYIMNDEICRLNLVIKDSHSFYEDLILSANDKKVIERIVVNILLGQFWTDLPHVKNSLKDVLKEQHEVDDVIPKITIVDEKNHKIRIKDQYESEFDPYLFYRAPAVQRDIFHAFNSKMKKDKPVDLVSGKRYTNQPEHLVAIQKGLFQSNLPDFLCRFLSKVLPLTTSFVRPALKLVLLNLQVVEDVFKSKKNDLESENLKNKVVECYLNSEFSNHLKAISSDENFKDCEGCIGKIRDLIKNLRKHTDDQLLHNNRSPGKEEAPNQQEEDKKNLARLKMQKLKEEFAKKQAKFAKTNSEILTETEESKLETESTLMFSEHVLTCQYCLDRIVENTDEYGVPIYVALTNNFYDTEKAPEFEKFDSTRLTQTSWWPVVSSCNHYYHKKCFVLLYKNSKKPSDSAKKHFSCENESYCSLCKTLCNSFLCVRENQKGDMQEEEPVAAEVFETFTKQIDSIFKVSMEKIAEMIHMEVSDEELELPIETIFLRAYTYFIEAFHIQEQSEAFEKDFNLYSMFFRKYVAHLKEKKIKLPQTRSFLSQVDLRTGQLIIPMDEVMKKQKVEQLQQYSSEDLLGNILFGVLDDMVPHESNLVDPIEVTNCQLRLLKEYLAFKLIQAISFVKGDDSHLLFKDLKRFYKENKEFSSKFIREITFPFQKMMLAFALNHNILLNESPFDDLLSLLIHPKDDLEYLNRLLNETGILLSFDDILDQAIGELDQRPEAEVLPLKILLSSRQSVIHNASYPRVIKYAPTSVKLPENYAEFNTKYFRMKCSLCKGYSQHLLSSICLICGEFMCQAYCDPKNKKFGNLNRHAGEYHMGLGLFLDVQHLSKTVLSVPVNAIYTGKNVYIDKLGQAIQVFLYERRSIISSLDFKKFVLNEEFLQNLKEIINRHSMGKEVFKIARTANYYYHNGNL